MLQDIIVILIITAAVAYSIYAVVKSLRSKSASNCDDCTGCDIKHEVLKKYQENKDKEPFHCGDFNKR